MGTKNYSNYSDLITFSRASNATYMDSDGLIKTASANVPRIEYDADGNRLGLLIEEARTNLSPNSNFNGGWTFLNSSFETDAAVSPDGTTNAVKLKVNTNSSHHSIYESVTGGTYSVSVFAKAGEYYGIQLTGVQTTNDHACFNLVDGTAYHTGTNASNATIEDVGNGWYRCSAVIPVTNGNLYIAVTDGVSTAWLPSFAGANTTDGIYIYGAQLEAGAFPTSYIPTSGSTATRAADIASIPVSAFGYNQNSGTVVCEGQTTVVDSNTRFFSLSDGTTNNRIAFSRGFIYHPYVSTGGVAQASLDAGTVNAGTLVKVATSFKQDDISSVIDGGSVATDTSATIPSVNKLYLGAGSTGSIAGACYIKSIKYFPRKLTNDQIVDLTS